ncbi:MAG: pyruvate ferredoxin oxidoreductase [Promethearchaeota archaeon]|nr:MAG: pyruvate ferredoxin oxidoreductase [Candidatus Lokiarchaeota archaeon]
MSEDDKIVEITFHGRGGQTAITASQLLAQLAFEKGFKDAIAIPIIGAERRGAPIQAFTKLSRNKKIKTYDSVKTPDYMLIFDVTLLNIPSIMATIKSGVTLVINSKNPIDTCDFPENVKYFIVDATGICINQGFMHSSGPILNIPMLGAFGKVTGFYDLDTMKKVIYNEFGEARGKKNFDVAVEAYNNVKEVEYEWIK